MDNRTNICPISTPKLNPKSENRKFVLSRFISLRTFAKPNPCMVPKMIASIGLNFSDSSLSSFNRSIASVRMPSPIMKPVLKSATPSKLKAEKVITMINIPNCIFLISRLGIFNASMLARTMVHPINDSMILISGMIIFDAASARVTL